MLDSFSYCYYKTVLVVVHWCIIYISIRTLLKFQWGVQTCKNISIRVWSTFGICIIFLFFIRFSLSINYFSWIKLSFCHQLRGFSGKLFAKFFFSISLKTFFFRWSVSLKFLKYPHTAHVIKKIIENLKGVFLETQFWLCRCQI